MQAGTAPACDAAEEAKTRSEKAETLHDWQPAAAAHTCGAKQCHAGGGRDEGLNNPYRAISMFNCGLQLPY